ncbi:MAG TPA: NAD(P)-dependent oxidoreductase [Trebonia sp.]|jgi:nucleoside-diphosphate-sugar epimerase|nr:NAD(P)-dependent oxidoreductase [Trebonia sp.]
MNAPKILVTGSSGHLGEALVRVLRQRGQQVAGLDRAPGPFTAIAGDIADRGVVRNVLARGFTAVVHTATLHKPHVASHPRQAFVDVNVTGTLNLLEESAAAGVSAFVYTSTTSAFGRALVPAPGEPAAWITEDVPGVAKNIYGATKTAAEDLCRVVAGEAGLPVVVLRTSRFFPEGDDDDAARARYPEGNLKANEFLHRRVDLADVADAHLLAVERAPGIGFGRYIISATTPFTPDDMRAIRDGAEAVVLDRYPEVGDEYGRRGWKLLPGIDRVYVNARARAELGWTPRHDFRAVLDALRRGEDPRSPLARAVGAKGYHDRPAGVYTA